MLAELNTGDLSLENTTQTSFVLREKQCTALILPSPPRSLVQVKGVGEGWHIVSAQETEAAAGFSDRVEAYFPPALSSRKTTF